MSRPRLQHGGRQQQHLPVRAASGYRDVGAGVVEHFDFRVAPEEGNSIKVRGSLENTKWFALGCNDVAVDPPPPPRGPPRSLRQL